MRLLHSPLARRAAALCLAALGIATVAAPASATVCYDFTLTEAVATYYANGSWHPTDFTQTGPGQFSIQRDPAWPAQITLLLRWDVKPTAHPEVLPGASYAPLPVYLDYQYVGDGFGTSFGAVAQVNNVTMAVGSSRPVYFEFAVLLPATGCDLIRADLAILNVTPWLQINPGTIPEIACLPPNCGPQRVNPGDAVINPNPVQRFDPQQFVPQVGGGQQFVPQAGQGQRQGEAEQANPTLLLQPLVPSIRR